MPVISQFTKWEIERSRRKNAFPAASIFSARSSTAATWPRSTPTATRSSIPTRGNRSGDCSARSHGLWLACRRAPVRRRARICERRQLRPAEPSGESFADAVRQVFGQEDARRAKVDAALRTAEEFSWSPRVTARFFQLYDDLFAQLGSASPLYSLEMPGPAQGDLIIT